MPFALIQGDVTRFGADAIVNAANPALQMGGGVCGAIFRAAGAEQLQRACDAIGGCETGGAVLTAGYGLPARHIIHAVGPVWRGGGQGEAALLRACYENALRLAKERGLRSIAFPLISAGIFGYPKEEALRIAGRAIGDFLRESDMEVFLVLFDAPLFALAQQILGGASARKDTADGV